MAKNTRTSAVCVEVGSSVSVEVVEAKGVEEVVVLGLHPLRLSLSEPLLFFTRVTVGVGAENRGQHCASDCLGVFRDGSNPQSARRSKSARPWQGRWK